MDASREHCLVIQNKKRAQVTRKACALVVSATLTLSGLAPWTALRAQNAGPVNPTANPVTPATNGAGALAPGNDPVRGAEIPDTKPILGKKPAALPGTLPQFNVPPLILPAPATGPEAPSLTGRVSRIAIVGNAKVTDPAIRAYITQSGLTLGAPYSAAAAEKARDAVKNMGYFNGDVIIDAETDPAGGVDVTFTVKENPLVKTIKFTANTPSGEPTIPAAKLKSLMVTQEGKVLNTNTLVADLDKLFNHQTGYVRAQGFIFDVSSDINIDPLTGVLNIPLVEAHINSITIKGNKKTKPIVIMREIRSEVGEVLDEKKLRLDLNRVNNTGLFDEVGPFDETSADVGKVDIVVPVTEKRSGQVSVGIGYSSRSKLVGQATLAENNFRGLGERVSLMWEVGGISSQSSLDFSFFEPYLDKKHTSLSLDVYNKALYRFASSSIIGGSSNTSGTNSTYIERRKGGVLGINRNLSDLLTVGITGRVESVSTDNFQVVNGDQFIQQQGTVSGLGIRGVFSNRDNENAPAAGGLLSLSYESVIASTRPVNESLPSPLAPGKEYFGKLGLDLRRYTSLQGPRKAGNFNQPKRVLATRLLIGATAKNIPFFEQYFLGGADSLRGYDTDRFWGSNLALFQAELRIPLGKDNNFQGVLLFDGGDAWNSIYQQQGLQQHTAFKLSTDYGVGIRLVTPIGPIRVDYAIPGNGGSGRTQFSIGQSF